MYLAAAEKGGLDWLLWAGLPVDLKSQCPGLPAQGE